MINPVKFQPPRSKGVGRDRGDKGCHPIFLLAIIIFLPPPSLQTKWIKIVFFKCWIKRKLLTAVEITKTKLMRLTLAWIKRNFSYLLYNPQTLKECWFRKSCYCSLLESFISLWFKISCTSHFVWMFCYSVWKVCWKFDIQFFQRLRLLSIQGYHLYYINNIDQP